VAEGQLQWDPEWRVPKTPHDSAKRERSTSFDSWPVDLVIFDSDEHAVDLPRFGGHGVIRRPGSR